MQLLLDTPERTRRVHRAAARFCAALGWAPLSEVPLPNGRRADILALLPDGGFRIIEVKSCARDFLSDRKWHEYRDFCDALLFAVDADFPQELLPEDVGLICAASVEDWALLRPAPMHPLAPARRRAMLLRYAMLAGTRALAAADPEAGLLARMALRLE